MLCLGPKKSLTLPRLELTAQGVAYQCSKSNVKTTRLSRRPNVVLCSRPFDKPLYSLGLEMEPWVTM